MEQVFVNLLTNAMQATDGRNGTIEITGRRNGDAVEIGIRDDGAGIKAADLGRIFDPFFTRSPSGTGLGLSIVRSIVEQHRGTIRVASAEGAGTTFTLAIPLARQTVETA